MTDSGSIKLAPPRPLLDQMAHCCLCSLEGRQEKRVDRSQTNRMDITAVGHPATAGLSRVPPYGASLSLDVPYYTVCSVCLARPRGCLFNEHVLKTSFGGAHGDLCFHYA